MVARVRRRLVLEVRSSVASAGPGLSSVAKGVIPLPAGVTPPANARARDVSTLGLSITSFWVSVERKLAEPRCVVVPSLNCATYHRTSMMVPLTLRSNVRVPESVS